MPKGSKRSPIAITVSWQTILKILAAALLVYVTILLWRFVELLLLSLIIAVAFRPMVLNFARRGWPHWVGVLVCGLLLFGSTALFFGMLAPTISTQGLEFLKKLPTLKESTLQNLPASGPVRNIADQVFSASPFSNPEPLLKQALAWGSAGLTRAVEFFVVLILALYLVAEGGRLYQWLVAFLPETQRRKLATAADEATVVVGHYVAGNLFTSVLCGIYAYIVLKILHVPGAALLAVLAGVFDLLPLIGFFLFAIPATLVALTVSPRTALLVAMLYGAYHLLENYFIVPKVYGNRLRLSELTVLVSCLAAGLVAGVIGVILVLPLVACYPIVERIWLQPHLEPDTVKLHEALDQPAKKRSR